MLYASTYEGFGMPIAEARATGASVIASDIPPHREASAGEALFIAPLDVDGWTRAMRDSFEMRRVDRTRGRSVFDWDDSARKTLALYDTVMRAL